MPYIATEQVRMMRMELKRRFPQFKLSVRKDNSTVMVEVKAGPIDFGVKDASVNHYYISEQWDGVARDFLLQVKDIISTGKYTESYDSDYGSIASWYIRIGIGSWDVPYQLKK